MVRTYGWDARSAVAARAGWEAPVAWISRGRCKQCVGHFGTHSGWPHCLVQGCGREHYVDTANLSVNCDVRNARLCGECISAFEIK